MKFTTIWNKLKEMISKMIGSKSVEQVLQVTPVISTKMANAIELWTDMYENQAPWLHEPTAADPTKVVSLGLPAMIASEKARMATLELKSEITTPVEEVEEVNPDYEPPELDKNGLYKSPVDVMNKMNTSPTITVEKPIGDITRANYLNSQYKKLLCKLRKQLEHGIATGVLIIKPYVVKEEYIDDDGKVYPARIEFDYMYADAFFPLAFDGSGRVTEAAFVQTESDKDKVYRRLEHHKLEGNMVTVTNKAFVASNTNTDGSNTDLGTEIQLTQVPEWKDIAPEAKIKDVNRLLFAVCTMPEANTIDRHSPLGVSGFSRAVDLIREADLQFSRLLWEYEGGELAIDIDRDAVPKVDDMYNPHSQLGKLQQRLYRKIDLGESDTYQPYMPTLRDLSYSNGLNTILMRIEDTCSISRGTLSDSVAEARTATELKILKQRSYAANKDLQEELERTLKDVIYIMDVYCTLYNIVPKGEYNTSFEWDDSILVDVNEELNKRLQLLQNGLITKVDLMTWYFGMTELQAKQKLAEIDNENMKSMEQNMMAQQSLFGEE